MDIRLRQPVPVSRSRSHGRYPGGTVDKPRSLKVTEWPEADRLAWAKACEPAQRLERGGAASHLAPVSKADFANRYGLYLDFLQRNCLLGHSECAVTLVTPDRVSGFVTELQARVRSVTVWNSVYKLRRASQLLAPDADFAWLIDIERDIALVMEPRSKTDRLVLTERLVEAGLTLIQEAEMFGRTAHARALGVRNGLLIALLALHPVRIKNFAALAITGTFINVEGRWWLRIPTDDTKSHRVDERQVPKFMTDVLDNYIKGYRSTLTRGNEERLDLWISSTTGKRMTTKNLGTLISKLTRETIGVDVSPHLFRTAGASTAAIYGGKHLHLASGLLSHRHSRIT